MTDSSALLLALCGLGIAGGLYLLWRGFGGYRMALKVGDTSTSELDSLAAGEVRISGTIEPAEVTLISPLQSVPCVWYRSSVRAASREERAGFAEERAVGFRVRDVSDSIRVFPARARIAAPDRFSGQSGFLGDPPVGLNLRTGGAFGPAVGPDDGTPLDREAAIARLLTVQPPEPGRFDPDFDGSPLSDSDNRRDYREARLEVGDVVTVVGTAMPFGQLPDPFGADRMDRAGDPLAGLDDPDVAAQVAAARAAGTLLTPEEAWGNAAIPGFGIGRPVREPELDPAARSPAIAAVERAHEAAARFDIAPDTLVIAATDDSPLLIAQGPPEVIVAREQDRFLLGLLGALLAVGSAIAGALIIGGQPT
jgi:hypothetical protein